MFVRDIHFLTFILILKRSIRWKATEIRFNMYNLSPDVCYRSVRRSILFLFHDSVRYMELLNFTFASDFISFDFLRSCGTCDKNTKLERWEIRNIFDNFGKIQLSARIVEKATTDILLFSSLFFIRPCVQVFTIISN